MCIANGVTTCNLISHNISLKLRLPCKTSLSYFIIYTLLFVKIAIQLSLKNYLIETKDLLDNPGKPYEFLRVVIKYYVTVVIH